jgi:hypothetical protein
VSGPLIIPNQIVTYSSCDTMPFSSPLFSSYTFALVDYENVMSDDDPFPKSILSTIQSKPSIKKHNYDHVTKTILLGYKTSMSTIVCKVEWKLAPYQIHDNL